MVVKDQGSFHLFCDAVARSLSVVNVKLDFPELSLGSDSL